MGVSTAPKLRHPDLPEVPAHQTGRRRAALLLFVAVCVMATAYLGGIAFDPLIGSTRNAPWLQLYGTMEVLGALVIALRLSPDARGRRTWNCFAVGLLLLGISAISATVPSAGLMPIADWGWLASFPAFIAGLLLLPGLALTPAERLRALVDSAILVTSAGLLIWYIGSIGVRVEGPPNFASFRLFNSFVLLGDALVGYTVAMLAVRTPALLQHRATLVLIASFVLSMAGDLLYVAKWARAEGTVLAPSAPEALWTLAAVLLAIASLRRDADADADLARPSLGLPARSVVRSRLSSLAPFAAASVLGVVALVEGMHLTDLVFRVLAVGLVVVGALLALRLALAMRENARLIAEQAQRADQMRESQKLEAVGRLAGGVAHEFNNLLMVIQQGTEAMLARAPGNDDARDVQAAAVRAAELTRQLLTFSRRESVKGVTDPAAALASLRPLLQRLLPPDVVLELRVASGLPPVALDRSGFDQVLFNLVRNAVDATAGVGRITLTLGPSAADGAVRLEVADTGAGIPDAVRARLFEPFFSTKPVGQGTGLGLAIVHGLVTGVGGRLDVESEPGAGARFIIEVPIASPDARAAAAPPSGGEVAPGEERCTVLLVDDEPTVRRSLRRTLERLGHTVVEAEDGAVALQLLGTRAASIDLVLTDTVMPNVDGWALIREVRQRYPTLPVLRMSGFAEPADDEHADVADGFLAKPFDLSALRAAVQAHAALRRAGG